MQNRTRNTMSNSFFGVLYIVVHTVYSFVLTGIILSRFGSEANGLVSSIKQIITLFPIEWADIHFVFRNFRIYGFWWFGHRFWDRLHRGDIAIDRFDRRQRLGYLRTESRIYSREKTTFFFHSFGVNAL